MSEKLGTRLEFLKNICHSYLEKNPSVLYDLCCDHGKLGLSLRGHENVQHIYLVDQVKSIIDNLLKVTSDIPGGGISVVLEDCTKIQKMDEKPKLVAIAGIGGLLSIRILDQISPFLGNDDTIIVSPHNNLDQVRDYLISSDYGFIEDYLIEEKNKFYEVILISKSSSNKFGLVGEFKNSDRDIKERYFKKNESYFKTKSEFEKDESKKEYFERIMKLYKL